MYNTTNLTNAITLGAIMTELNHLTDGVLGILILMSMFIIVLFANRNDIKKSFGTASFITFIVGILLRLLNMIPNEVLFITIATLTLSILVLWTDRASAVGV